MNRLIGTLLAASLLGACTTTPPRPSPSPPEAAATRSQASEALEALGEAYWELLMRHSPTWATFAGDRRYDAELTDASEAAILARQEEREALQRQLAAIDRGALSDKERVTADVMAYSLGSTRAQRACKPWLWSVDQLGGPQTGMPQLARFFKVSSPQDARNLLNRYRKVAGVFDATVANLRKGLEQGYVAPRINVERVIRQLEDQSHLPPADTEYMKLALKQLDDSGLEEAALVDERGRPIREQLLVVVRDAIYPAMNRYLALLKSEILPQARESVGVSALPGGAACYQEKIERSTGMDAAADEIHAIGLSEVERILKEMEALIRSTGSQSGVEAHLAELNKAPDLRLDSRDAILEYNRQLIDRAMKQLPKAFETIPEAKVEVIPIPETQERDAPAAFYVGPPADGSRPAYYYVNTYKPPTRPTWTMAALAFHEAVPGHHLQNALSSENDDLPRFQREVGMTAFGEGWALYAESLAGELGLYHTPEEQMGALSYEMWRAVRLVVDTGMHAKGWSRQEALDYLIKHTSKDPEEAANEIDRYIVWPGQALAYKIGQLEIEGLREEARSALGERFDLAAFHTVVLSSGSVPLKTLRRNVEAWIAAQRP
ncbi:MAG: hypothetical protein CMH57_14395 [Myxococcales bacterium]|nr:hypothetical protein [Myxococcales bacterium]